MRLAAILTVALVLIALPLRAADQATLVADRVTLQSQDLLVAAGHVEVFFKGQRLTATEVTYDAARDRLQIKGPIRIEDGQGTLILADSADLSADLTDGLIRTARIVMDQQLQLATAEMLRSNSGRVTVMRSVVASSCRICGNGPPLWEIRAARMTHDAAAQQIWFDNATLRLVGLPVLWLPVLRIPDPSLKRATGFLMPELRSSTALGTGISLPYFITLGPSRDLTLRPFVTNNDGRTLGWRYRQAFDRGTLDLEGAFSRDQLQPDDLRGYVRAKATFDMGGGWQLGLDGTVVSDPAYLQDYGISDDDRLISTLRLTRVTFDSFTGAELSALRTLRATESNATQPTSMARVGTERRLTPAVLGGIATFYSEATTVRRNAISGLDGDGDGIADGRDMSRLSLGVNWTRRWVSEGGLVLDGGAQAGADLYSIAQDAVYAGQPQRALARAGVKLAWPLLRKDKGGATLIEPALQLVRAAAHVQGAVPNEDSRLVEFDEGNLYSLDRFPGADAIEGGTRLNLGVTITREADAGPGWGMTVGRVLRLDGARDFSAPTGLGGAASDWLMAGQIQIGSVGGTQLAFAGRAMIDDSLSLSRFESRFALTATRASLSGGYEFVNADPGQGRTADVREVVLNGTARLGDFWTVSATDRYDLSTQTTRASLGLGFRNECLAVDLSVSRRFTSSSIVEASSDVGLTVELLGLGGASKGQAATTCRR